MKVLDVLNYVIVYFIGVLVLMASLDWRFTVPMFVWLFLYIFLLRYFIPKLRKVGERQADARSTMTGRIVDSYTNILTVKLFARARDEDAYVREVIDDHTGAIARHMRLITTFMTTLSALNALLLVSTAAIGITLWSQGVVDAGTVATALPLAERREIDKKYDVGNELYRILKEVKVTKEVL